MKRPHDNVIKPHIGLGKKVKSTKKDDISKREQTLFLHVYGYFDSAELKGPRSSFSDCESQEFVPYTPVQYNRAHKDFDGWNEEFQKYYNLPRETSRQKLDRAVHILSLYEHFVEVATEISKEIINQVGTKKKTILSSSQMGGIAGGEKYMKQGIFFKFVRDVVRLYGSDHFSIKAAGHEVKSINALLETNIPNVHLPMVTVVDYYGYRVLAASAVPINKSSIIYGCRDGGRTIHDSSAEMRDLMRQVANALNLKEHVVGVNGITKEPKPLFGPCDIEGHLGKDGRYYLVDTARLFPPEEEFDTIYGLLIPMRREEQVEIITLRKPKLKADVAKYIGHGHHEKHFHEAIVTMYISERGEGQLHENASVEEDELLERNNRASTLVGRDIYGDVVVLRGSKLHIFYYLLRPELVTQSKVPLSSDAFSKFGEDKHQEHDAEVMALTIHLRDNVVPEFVKWADSNPEKIISGLHLPPILHRKGINLRYIGRMYNLTKNSRLKYNIFGFQIIARVLKNLLRAKLRSEKVTSHEQYREAIVDFFNLVFGESKKTEYFWEHEMPIHILLKYAPFGFRFSDEEPRNLKFILGKVPLFHMLQEYTGVKFTLDSDATKRRFVDQAGEFEPLRTEELKSIETLAKKVDCRSKILPFIDECYPVNKTLKESPEKAVHLQEEHRTVVKVTYGHGSPEMAATTIRLADLYSSVKGDAVKAEEMILDCLKSMNTSPATPGEIILGCFYLMALIYERHHNYRNAEFIYTVILARMEELYDSVDDAYSASPFESQLRGKLIKLLEKRDAIDMVLHHKKRIELLKEVFPLMSDDEAVYGRVLSYLSFNNLSGYNIPPEDEEFTELASALVLPDTVDITHLLAHLS